MSLTLEQTLASILQSLANFFGVTTQTIMENAPMWLAKYGWYVTVKDLGFNIFVGGFYRCYYFQYYMVYTISND